MQKEPRGELRTVPGDHQRRHDADLPSERFIANDKAQDRSHPPQRNRIRRCPMCTTPGPERSIASTIADSAGVRRDVWQIGTTDAFAVLPQRTVTGVVHGSDSAIRSEVSLALAPKSLMQGPEGVQPSHDHDGGEQDQGDHRRDAWTVEPQSIRRCAAPDHVTQRRSRDGQRHQRRRIHHCAATMSPVRPNIASDIAAA